ncbi:MAG: hypothetical protein WC238_05975 [Parcubacteria group bacterium]
MAKEDKEGLLKRAIIAGAAHALTYKDKHYNSSQQEVLKHIVKEVKNIIDEIDK